MSSMVMAEAKSKSNLNRKKKVLVSIIGLTQSYVFCNHANFFFFFEESLFKAFVHYFSLFLKEQYVSWLFRTKYFEIKFNLQLLYLPIVSRAFILS